MDLKLGMALIGRDLDVSSPLTGKTVKATIVSVCDNSVKAVVPILGEHTEICEVLAQEGVLNQPCWISQKDIYRINGQKPHAKAQGLFSTAAKPIGCTRVTF